MENIREKQKVGTMKSSSLVSANIGKNWILSIIEAHSNGFVFDL